MKEWFMNWAMSDVFWPVVSYVLLRLGNAASRWIDGYRKEHTNTRAKDVVMECMQAAFVQVFPDIAIALKDGTISESEWDAIKSKAILLAKPRLEELASFAKTDIADWINLQFDVLKIEFMRKIMGKELISPNDEATVEVIPEAK